MGLIVAKFGGTSVADPARIEAAASKVAREAALGHRVAVVVSAMAGVTNQLVSWCQGISPDCDLREYDAVVASGEQVTAGLMAIALQKQGLKARSWQGWQAGVMTDSLHSRAHVRGVESAALRSDVESGIIPVLTGFQGVTEEGRITTLGRGGSDTSAVALAAALQAERCDIYTDVDGVYTTDPRIVPLARKLGRISYEEMLEMASLGAKVLHSRSVELAMIWNVPVQVLSTFAPGIGSEFPGTLVTREEDIVERQVVNGIAFSRDEAKITLIGVPDMPGIAARVFSPLADAAINVDMIVQNISPDGQATDMTFTVPRGDLRKALQQLEKVDFISPDHIRVTEGVAKVSVVGIGMQSHSGVAKTMFQALADKGINIQVISTSEIKISVLIAEEYTELAVRALHAAFGLDARGD